MRNALSVVSTCVQTVAILRAAAWTTPWAWWPPAWFVAVLLLGRTNAQFASLMHEAAHRLLFSNKVANDVVGRWRVRLTFLKIVLVQIVLAVLMTLFGHPLMYPLLWLLPYRIGWHLAHHVDSGIPFRNLPECHRALVEAGYASDALEYPSYRALWSRLCSGN
ncbi:unannotated protein [freshwater metagenome]|uniref:Unannotated protein n=1 Tax=freshwater metagenome TaxID=449393 RepID=A0A6J6U5B2_9ZZZZ